MNNLVCDVREFARKAHLGQFRKYIEPKVEYFTHPMRVAQSVLAMPNSTDIMVAAAFLHDVLEDCPHIGSFEICTRFGGKVTDLVIGLTSRSKQISVSAIRAIRKKIDHEYLATQPVEVKLIKLEDRYDNLKDMSMCPDKSFVKLYCAETRGLLEAIGNADLYRAKDIRTQIEYLENGPTSY